MISILILTPILDSSSGDALAPSYSDIQDMTPVPTDLKDLVPICHLECLNSVILIFLEALFLS